MDSTATELGRQLGPLRRSLLRATRDVAQLPDIADSHIEVMRALAAEPSMSPGRLATRLNLARSTVSNLIRAMVDAGLVERSITAGDLRGATLTASPKAVKLLAEYDAASSRVLADALDELSRHNREAIAAALPALAEITSILSRRSS
ncbi:MarR family transcriptional regulator [Rhodococcus fascians]|jgi:DNA-binding MarR family transcriptional regulator|uniref:MarR family winged helix-turn-helix transcriptional regulator n=1 Tax=Nocardiaceae TaxID=85025 RepID=UPI00050CF567|nr:MULTISPECIES: MarR family transcriptional regulator [Rhodococcus]OZD56973.1 MarR family transcriptional regulator [Rhodococcus sp. 06-1477-1B]RZL70252.1 MAG: MarR family transcriptional regulator [Rhodococcus sp. (in: high G+C Gram-positive bacteria)]MBM7243097.1 MarR family transcriptional regulator [Rhodococcus fascians]MBY3808807.1 MarR family transcriptional regulator [Rhodococcus fascians]MBY3841245.1 MarR family transcriptional regulator [Rhodococcus fascians]